MSIWFSFTIWRLRNIHNCYQLVPLTHCKYIYISFLGSIILKKAFCETPITSETDALFYENDI